MLAITYSISGYSLNVSWEQLTTNQNLVRLARQDGTILSDRDKIKYLFKYLFESFSFLLEPRASQKEVSPSILADLIAKTYDQSNPKAAFAIAFLKAMDGFGI